MTIGITDSRLAEGDRLLSHYERDGVPTNIVKEMLPALVSPSAAVRDAAGRWLLSNARVGHGIPNDEQEAREYRAIQVQAREYVRAARASNPQAVPDVPGFAARFHPSEDAFTKRVDEAMPVAGYPGSRENAERLEASATSTDPDADALARWK